jgi:uncharacterized repeat protein (TIGR02543 family)
MRTDVKSTVAERSVTASFAPSPYAMSFKSNGGSAIATITRSYGAVVPAPAAPTKHGYAFAGWYSDPALATPYVFLTMGLNTTLYAKWAVASTFTLAPSAGPRGVISPAATQTVYYRDTKTFTITPAAGYHTVAVLLDGVSVGARSSVTFRNVTANHTISATFAFTMLKTSLSITSNKTTVARGTSVGFSGTISPHVPNGTSLTVKIRSSSSTTWTVLATRGTFSNKWSYSYKIPKTQARGTYYVRVYYAGSAKYLPCVSGNRKLLIK